MLSTVSEKYILTLPYFDTYYRHHHRQSRANRVNPACLAKPVSKYRKSSFFPLNTTFAPIAHSPSLLQLPWGIYLFIVLEPFSSCPSCFALSFRGLRRALPSAVAPKLSLRPSSLPRRSSLAAQNVATRLMQVSTWSYCPSTHSEPFPALPGRDC